MIQYLVAESAIIQLPGFLHVRLTASTLHSTSSGSILGIQDSALESHTCWEPQGIQSISIGATQPTSQLTFCYLLRFAIWCKWGQALKRLVSLSDNLMDMLVEAER